MSDFDSHELFGGAITVEIPSGYIDASDIRQVPDHQEVFIQNDGHTSIIVDILERVGQDVAPTDEDALKFHFTEMVAGSGDETKFWGQGEASMKKMPNKPALTLFATQHPVQRGPNDAPPRGPAVDFTGIVLVLMRLANEETDIVISINVPHIKDSYDSSEVDLDTQKLGGLLEGAVAARDRILETFEIKDFGLFG